MQPGRDAYTLSIGYWHNLKMTMKFRINEIWMMRHPFTTMLAIACCNTLARSGWSGDKWQVYWCFCKWSFYLLFWKPSLITFKIFLLTEFKDRMKRNIRETFVNYNGKNFPRFHFGTEFLTEPKLQFNGHLVYVYDKKTFGSFTYGVILVSYFAVIWALRYKMPFIYL